MIEFEIFFDSKNWTETFDSAVAANIRWNELVNSGAKVVAPTSFIPTPLISI